MPSCKDKVIMSYLGLRRRFLVQSNFDRFYVNFFYWDLYPLMLTKNFPGLDPSAVPAM